VYEVQGLRVCDIWYCSGVYLGIKAWTAQRNT
jgi:hypothetical protein